MLYSVDEDGLEVLQEVGSSAGPAVAEDGRSEQPEPFALFFTDVSARYETDEERPPEARSDRGEHRLNRLGFS